MRINILLVLLGSVVVIAGVMLVAKPTTLIEDVFISDTSESFIYTIQLSLPFEYIDHFPKEKTELVQVSLGVNSWFEINANHYFGSETIVPDILQSQLMTDIAYEAMVVGESYLTIRFKQPVNYLLMADEASKNIVIRVNK